MSAVETLPNIEEYVVTTSEDKGSKIKCLDRAAFANAALPFVDWSEAESRDSGRGPYKTTGQQSFYVERNGDRIQVNFSANFFAKDRKGSRKAESGKDSDQQLYTLAPSELVLIDKLAEETMANDPSRAGALMTIRIVADQNQGKVPWKLLKIAKDALESK